MGRQGRVLIVDDLPQWREELVETLLTGGMYAEAVSTVAHALEKLDESLYHLLVVDIRMEEGDFKNTDGMYLLSELEKRGLSKAIKVIVLSAHGTLQQIRQAFREHHVTDFLSKDQFNNQDFLQTVHAIFKKELKINLNLQIHWDPEEAAERIVSNLKLDGVYIKQSSLLLSRLTSEMDDLLCRLFYSADSILVQPLSLGYSGAGVLWVQPFYSTGGGRAVVIKFGACNKIEEEQDNFIQYVRPFVGGGRNTAILGVCHTPLLGGIIYSLLGTGNDQLEDFESFYRRAKLTSICRVVDGLFLDTCKAWYANLGHLQLYNLTESYQQPVSATAELLEEIFDKYLIFLPGRQRLIFKSLNSNRTFTNPLPATASRSFARATYVCITHGDLNPYNLLIDEAGRSWLIDFQETGKSYFLRDVAMLDSVIRYQLLAPEEATLEERLQMEEALCGIKRFSQLESLKTIFATRNEALAKAYAVVIHLRILARKLVVQKPNDDLSEYYIALLYNALNALHFSSLSIRQREHALLSASLFIDRLELNR